MPTSPGVHSQPDLAASIRKMQSDIANLQRGTQQAQAPLASVEATVAQSLGVGVAGGNLTFDTVDFDNVGMWDAATPTILTVPYAGVFLAVATATFATNGDGSRTLRIRTDDATDRATLEVTPNAADPTTLSVTAFARLGAGATIAAEAFQKSTGPLDVLSAKLDVAYLGVA